MKVLSETQYRYSTLLGFVNESLTEDNWKATLQDVEAWQLEWELGLESSPEDKAVPKIFGVDATYKGARELQASLREQLSQLAGLCLDAQRLTSEAKVWTWRKALALPTGELFFEDAGEALSFLVERLEYEIRQRAKAAESADSRERRRWVKPRLHLTFCQCGCGKFFLWEGNWNRKQRKFLDNKHRMGFHNPRNVARKRELARRRRSEGKYL